MAFTKVLKKLEDFTLPTGAAMLQKWIAVIKEANNHFNEGDLKAVGQLAHDFMPALRGILPAIPNKTVYAAIGNLVATFETELDKSMTDGSATLIQIDKLYQFAAHTILSAMSKAKLT